MRRVRTHPVVFALAGAFALVSAAPTSLPAQVMWTTLAGQPTGSEDGPATLARFSLGESGLAVDTAGNLYVADSGNNTIRRVAPDGSVTTLAGSGENGFLDGSAGQAQFSGPTGVAVDAAGNVYVADPWNHRIRRVAPDGLVTTVAGNGEPGATDGPASTARLDSPVALALDKAGTLFFAEQGSNRIRKLSPDGFVRSVAGSGAAGFADGPATEARFNNPSGLAVDASGNLYVADKWNDRIRKISAAGIVTTFAGTGEHGFADGPGSTAGSTGQRGSWSTAPEPSPFRTAGTAGSGGSPPTGR